LFYTAICGVGDMDELKNILEQNYSLKIKDIEKVKNAYKVETEEGYKCFKVTKYGIELFTFITNAIQHLLDKGFKGVLPFYITNEGKKFIEIGQGYGFLCDWVESREADFKNPVELKLCVETLSNLHLTSRGFNLELGAKGRRNYGKWIDKFQKRCDELLYFKSIIPAKNSHSEFDSIFLKHFNFYYRQSINAIKDLRNSKYFEVMEEHKKLLGFCHHDTANHNFLITPELHVYMIDFDYCILDSHLHDLGSIIIRNLKHGNWNFDTLDYIINIYNQNIPINQDELYIIYCFMEYPQDFWQVGLQYYVEKQPWDEEFFVKKLSRIVKDGKDRIDFLKEYQNFFKGK
jgi:CotS family spore coat protein